MDNLKSFLSTSNDNNFFTTLGGKYTVPEHSLDEFYSIIRNIQKNDLNTDFNMHEVNNGRSGLWIDLDIYQRDNHISQLESKLSEFISIIHTRLDKYYQISSTPYHVFVLHKNVRLDKAKGEYKDSWHIRIPKFQLSKSARKALLLDIKDNSLTFLEDIYRNISSNIDSIIDTAVVSNHPLVYGCVKRNDTTHHDLYAVFMLHGTNIVRKEIKDKHIHRAVSLINGNYDTPVYLGEDDPVVQHVEYGNIKANKYKYINDPDFMFLYRICKHLPEDYSQHGFKWRNILQNLARILVNKADYLDLAHYFSKKNPKYFDMYDSKAIETIESIYDKTVTKSTSLGFFCYLARKLIPDKFQEIADKNISCAIWDKLARNVISNFTVPDVWRILRPFCGNYKTDILDSARNQQKYIWYEYVPEYIHKKFPEAYPRNMVGKWNRHASHPQSLSSLLMEVQDRFCNLINDINKKYLSAEDERQRKRLKAIVEKGIGSQASVSNLFNVSSTNTMSFLKDRLLDRGFADKLDADDRYMGVMNGVIKLENGIATLVPPSPDLYISQCTKCEYHGAFDISNPYHARIKNICETIFRNSQATKDLYFTIASSLFDKKISDILFILISPGSSGKSTLLRFFENTFGDRRKGGYILKQNDNWLSEYQGAEKASPATYQCKDARLILINELPDNNLNHSTIKGLWEGKATRDLFISIEDIKITGAIIAYRNEPINAKTSDPGFWRRIAIANLPNIFTAAGDFKEDTSIRDLMQETTPDHLEYRNAFMAYVLDYYRRYYEKVIKPNTSLRAIVPYSIKQRTNNNRLECDAVYKFLKTRLVSLVGNKLSLADIAQEMRRCCDNIPRHLEHIIEQQLGDTCDIISDIDSKYVMDLTIKPG